MNLKAAAITIVKRPLPPSYLMGLMSAMLSCPDSPVLHPNCEKQTAACLQRHEPIADNGIG
jgi:hypothetical protein